MQTHRTAVSLVSDQGVERLPRLSTAHLALALGGPVAITVAAWIYLAVVARDMSAMSSMAMAMPIRLKFPEELAFAEQQGISIRH